MALYDRIDTWDKSVPTGTEQLSQADDHMRGIKRAVENTFPNIQGGPVNASDEELNTLVGFVHGGLSVEERFAAIETILGDVDADEMATLDGITAGVSIESRLAAMETTLGAVDATEIAALIGYDLAGYGTIEARFQNHATAINQITSGVDTSLINLSSLSVAVDDIIAWQNARTAAANNAQIAAIATFAGAALPVDYNNDLGHDMQVVAAKLETLEYYVFGDVPTGRITWKNFFANLGINGAINVTNTLNTKDRFGFVVQGLSPGTSINMRFYSNAQGGWGGYLNTVNPNKEIRVSDTGEAHVDLSIGSALDTLGVGGARLPEDSSRGRLQVLGVIQGTDYEHVVGEVECVFYEDTQVVTPV